MGEIGLELRSLMDVTGFRKTKVGSREDHGFLLLTNRHQLIGFEHNWVDAAAYPVQLVPVISDSLHGVLLTHPID
jgi:hypothetical protein